MSAQTLREAAAVLLAEADKLEGKPSNYLGVNLSDPKEAWAQILREIAERQANVESERDIGSIVTAYKPVIDAAHREGWPSNLGAGKTFWLGNYKTAKELSAALRALMQTEQYKAWAAHPLNAHLLPKVAP